jgi:hypothetical protein
MVSQVIEMLRSQATQKQLFLRTPVKGNSTLRLKGNTTAQYTEFSVEFKSRGRRVN